MVLFHAIRIYSIDIGVQWGCGGCGQVVGLSVSCQGPVSWGESRFLSVGSGRGLHPLPSVKICHMSCRQPLKMNFSLLLVPLTVIQCVTCQYIYVCKVSYWISHRSLAQVLAKQIAQSIYSTRWLRNGWYWSWYCHAVTSVQCSSDYIPNIGCQSE